MLKLYQCFVRGTQPTSPAGTLQGNRRVSLRASPVSDVEAHYSDVGAQVTTPEKLLELLPNADPQLLIGLIAEFHKERGPQWFYGDAWSKATDKASKANTTITSYEEQTLLSC